MAGRSTAGKGDGTENEEGKEARTADGRLFKYWLAKTLSTAREARDIKRADLASALSVSEKTLQRLEDPSYPGLGDTPDRLVAGYAFALGLDDSRDLWAKAIKDWADAGADPLFRPAFEPLSENAEGFLRVIRDTAQRHPRSLDAPTRKRSATPRTRRAR